MYRIAVANELLRHGKVDTRELSRRIIKDSFGVFNWKCFEAACREMDTIYTKGKE